MFLDYITMRNNRNNDLLVGEASCKIIDSEFEESFTMWIADTDVLILPEIAIINIYGKRKLPVAPALARYYRGVLLPNAAEYWLKKLHNFDPGLGAADLMPCVLRYLANPFHTKYHETMRKLRLAK